MNVTEGLSQMRVVMETSSVFYGISAFEDEDHEGFDDKEIEDEADHHGSEPE